MKIGPLCYELKLYNANDLCHDEASRIDIIDSEDIQLDSIWAHETIDGFTEVDRQQTDSTLGNIIHCSEEHPGPRSTLAVSNIGLQSQEGVKQCHPFVSAVPH